MRNMRQVIKTNHNFVTGEHYEQRVLKPVQASHNRVTIQLCDATSGNVIEEATTENAITPLLECSAYGSIAKQLNHGDIAGGCPYPAFESIILSDSDISELEDLYFIHGNVVGMCNREDTGGAGTHKQRGTYNSAESYQKIEDNGYKHIHLVYDWPTSSGNGKIQNIYWLPASIKFDNIEESRPIGIIQKFTSAYDKTDIVFDKRGNAYKVKDSKYYKVLNLLKAINSIEEVKTETDESFHNNYEVNGSYYTFSSAYADANKSTFTATLTINKHDTTGAIIDTWTEDLVTGVPQLVELKNNAKLGSASASVRDYCDDNGWVGFQLSFDSGNSSWKVFPTRNSEGDLNPNSTHYTTVYTVYNVLTKQWLHVPSPWDIWCTYEHYTNYKVIKKIDDKHICTSGYYVYIDTANSDVTAEKYSYNWQSPGNTYRSTTVACLHASLPICQATGYYDSGIMALRPLSAQTRLAAPITKTSLNTMKIQYDFFFKIPLPYMSPEHVWDLYK